jgi:high-affinity Fe2+/Pb2+ permease
VATTKKKVIKDFDNGIWSFDEQLDFNRAYGFIYLIYCSRNGMAYIGKKNFKGAGKLNKGTQSNWRTYTGSSKSLQADIAEFGVDAFEFYVLEQYRTKGGHSWAEIWSQVTVEVPSNNHIWYNRLIEKCLWKVSEPPTEKHRKRLKELTKGLG